MQYLDKPLFQSGDVTVTDAFHKQLVEIDLTLACVGEVNTTIRGGIHWPILYGVGELDRKECCILLLFTYI